MKNNFKKISILGLGFVLGAGSLVFAATQWQGTDNMTNGQVIIAATIKGNFDYLYERVQELGTVVNNYETIINEVKYDSCTGGAYNLSGVSNEACTAMLSDALHGQLQALEAPGGSGLVQCVDGQWLRVSGICSAR